MAKTIISVVEFSLERAACEYATAVTEENMVCHPKINDWFKQQGKRLSDLDDWIAEHESNVEDLDQTLIDLIEKSKLLLPVEKVVKDCIQGMINRLSSEKRHEEGKIRSWRDEYNRIIRQERDAVTSLAHYGRLFKVFDLEPLSWVGEDDFPKFAIFDLRDTSKPQSCTIKGNYGRSVWSCLTNLIKPIVHTMCAPLDFTHECEGSSRCINFASKCHHTSFERSVAFGFALPDDIRELIQKYTEELSLYIIAEASWENKEPRINNHCLLIGTDGALYYLMAEFDVIPIQEWIATAHAARVIE